VQVAHGVTVGRNVLLAAQVGIAGSSTLEDSVTLAGQVGVSGHITIGKGTIATAQTGVPNSVDPGSFISGYTAISNRDWLKSAVFRKLPELRKAITDLDARLAGAGIPPEITGPRCPCHNRCARNAPSPATCPVSFVECVASVRAGALRRILAARAATRPTRLDSTMATLSNGMQVVFLEDHSTPIVHAEICTTSAEERAPGENRFCASLRHYDAQGVEERRARRASVLISSIGGQSNAYRLKTRSSGKPAVAYLPLVLWLEADRLATLRIDEDVFKTEREIVKEERRADQISPTALNELIL
jgi:hypothetical protein